MAYSRSFECTSCGKRVHFREVGGHAILVDWQGHPHEPSECRLRRQAPISAEHGPVTTRRATPEELARLS